MQVNATQFNTTGDAQHCSSATHPLIQQRNPTLHGQPSVASEAHSTTLQQQHSKIQQCSCHITQSNTYTTLQQHNTTVAASQHDIIIAQHTKAQCNTAATQHTLQQHLGSVSGRSSCSRQYKYSSMVLHFMWFESSQHHKILKVFSLLKKKKKSV